MEHPGRVGTRDQNKEHEMFLSKTTASAWSFRAFLFAPYVGQVQRARGNYRGGFCVSSVEREGSFKPGAIG